MHLIGLARLGRDSELRFLQDGTAVLNLALAFNYGKKDGGGNRPTQWVDASMFGERAEKLAPHFLKGTQLNVHLADPRIETYPKRDGGEGVKLVARLDTFEFAGGNAQPAQGQNAGGNGNAYAAATGRPAPAARPASQPAASFDIDDLDIPF